MGFMTREAVLETAKKTVGNVYGDVEITAVELVEIPKYNEVCPGLKVELTGKLSPVIYGVDQFANEESVIASIENAVYSVRSKTAVTESCLKDRSKWRLKALNYEMAEKSGYLRNRAYIKILDLAILPCIIIASSEGEIGSVCLSVDNLERICETTIQEFIDVANKNDIIEIKRMTEVLKELCADQLGATPDLIEFDPPLYVVRDKGKDDYGTSLFANMDKMREIREEIGDFYILPSSIHELLVIPIESEAENRDDINNMVRMVNEDALAESDILSDHAYLFDGELKVA